MSRYPRFISDKEFERISNNGWTTMLIEFKFYKAKAEKIKKNPNIKFKEYETASSIRDVHWRWLFYKTITPVKR